MPRYRYKKYKRKELFSRLEGELVKKTGVKNIDEFLSEIRGQINTLEKIQDNYKFIEEANKEKREQYLRPVQELWSKVREIERSSENRTLWGWGGLDKESTLKVDKLKKQISLMKEPEQLSNSIEWGYKQKQELFDLKEIRKLANEKLRASNKQEKERLSKENEKQKRNEVRARIAGYEGKTREVAFSIKKELEVTEKCPYCNNFIGKSPHADHIYPVSKGGNSNKNNMIYVCKECNMKKSDLTLREFIKKAGFNRDEVEERLECLGKSF